MLCERGLERNALRKPKLPKKDTNQQLWRPRLQSRSSRNWPSSSWNLPAYANGNAPVELTDLAGTNTPYQCSHFVTIDADIDDIEMGGPGEVPTYNRPASWAQWDNHLSSEVARNLEALEALCLLATSKLIDKKESPLIFYLNIFSSFKKKLIPGCGGVLKKMNLLPFSCRSGRQAPSRRRRPRHRLPGPPPLIPLFPSATI